MVTIEQEEKEKNKKENKKEKKKEEDNIRREERLKPLIFLPPF